MRTCTNVWRGSVDPDGSDDLLVLICREESWLHDGRRHHAAVDDLEVEWDSPKGPLFRAGTDEILRQAPS